MYISKLRIFLGAFLTSSGFGMSFQQFFQFERNKMDLAWALHRIPMVFLYLAWIELAKHLFGWG